MFVGIFRGGRARCELAECPYTTQNILVAVQLIDELFCSFLELYFLDQGRTGKPKLTGEVVSEALSTLDETGRPSVSMRMNAAGSRTWAKWTAIGLVQ